MNAGDATAGKQLILTTVVLLVAGVLFGWPVQPTARGQPPNGIITSEEARAIATVAYIYGFPLVDNYRILYSYFVDRGDKEFKAPWNEIHNDTRVYTL